MSESYPVVVPRQWDAAVFVPAPRPDVFDFLADPRNRPRWQASLDRVEMIDEGEPHVGMRWVDRHIRRPRLEHRQDRHDRLGRPGKQQRHPLPRTRALAGQQMRQPVSGFIQLPIR